MRVGRHGSKGIVGGVTYGLDGTIGLPAHLTGFRDGNGSASAQLIEKFAQNVQVRLRVRRRFGIAARCGRKRAGISECGFRGESWRRAWWEWEGAQDGGCLVNEKVM